MENHYFVTIFISVTLVLCTSLVFPPALALWVPTMVIISTSVMRALRLGYNAELYIISACFYMPILTTALLEGDSKVALRNMAYAIVSVVGAYRWGIEEESIKESS